MRCGLVCALVLLILVPAAGGATTPTVNVQATPTTGSAPLQVSFAATGDAISYHWEFGDGGSADGPTVQHTYAAGRWTATLTARSSDGGTSTQTAAVITAYGLSLTAPNPARYGRRAVFRGSVVPVEGSLPVVLTGPHGRLAATRTKANGAYTVVARVRQPGAYLATTEHASSTPLELRVAPKLHTGFTGSGARGSSYFFAAQLVPASAGRLAVKITRGSEVLLDHTFGARVRVKLDTRKLTSYRVRVEALPNTGYAGAARVLHANVVLPRLVIGSRNSTVAQLGNQLRRLHYAAPYGLSFDGRMVDAVYAFQKVNGLPRTGVVDDRFWRALSSPRLANPRFALPSAHLEVNKGLQVLYVVRNGGVAPLTRSTS